MDAKKDRSKSRIGWLLLVVVASLCLWCSWVNITHQPQPAVPRTLYAITDFSICKGLDEYGKSVKTSSVFSVNDKNIFSCGYLQTNQPITLSVRWYFEDKMLFKDVIHEVDGEFISQLDAPNEGFSQGNYEVQILISRAVMWTTKFRVAER